MCGRCKNHGMKSLLKGHRLCNWRLCQCQKCLLIVKRQQLMQASRMLLLQQKGNESTGISDLVLDKTTMGENDDLDRCINRELASCNPTTINNLSNDQITDRGEQLSNTSLQHSFSFLFESTPDSSLIPTPSEQLQQSETDVEDVGSSDFRPAKCTVHWRPTQLPNSPN